MNAIRFVAPLLVTLTLAGCSSEALDEGSRPTTNPLSENDENGDRDQSPTAAPSATDACASLCARLVTCDPDADEDTCAAQCENTNAAFLSKVNDAFERELVACIDGAACRDLESGHGVPSCSAEARARLAPSNEAVELCDDYAAAIDKCGGAVDKTQCYLAAKIYDNEALAGARKCLSKSCGDIDACFRASLAMPGENVPPATTCTAELSYEAPACGSCMQASCCAEDNACAGEPQCMTYYACATECTSAECLSACASAYPSGKRALDSLASCMNGRCGASCDY